MKLYYSPGACSLAPHITLLEAGLTFKTESVNLQTKKTQSGADFTKINPKGYVPAMELDNGQVLTEGAVIMKYIADQKPEKELLPKAGSFERYRAAEWVVFVSTELHKGFAPLWNAKVPDDMKEMTKATLGKRFDYLSEQLKGKKFLMGDKFMIADAYMFTVLNWAPMVKFDLSKWPALLGHIENVRNRPAVQAALKAEGLLK